jgi:hypothetical protein
MQDGMTLINNRQGLIVFINTAMAESVFTAASNMQYMLEERVYRILSVAVAQRVAMRTGDTLHYLFSDHASAGSAQAWAALLLPPMPLASLNPSYVTSRALSVTLRGAPRGRSTPTCKRAQPRPFRLHPPG